MLKAPFPYFGGKSVITHVVWEHFGNVPNYVEPFAGSLAVLLGRPHEAKIETVNDKDGFICNVWRAIQADPEQVAYYADYPANECDLHARHSWLNGQREDITRKLEGDPGWFDVKAAGWWIWGMSLWIGSGFCSGKGAWQIVDGELIKTGQGTISRKMLNMNSGMGVHRKRVNLRKHGGGVHRKILRLSSGGQGVSRQKLHLSTTGQGIRRTGIDNLYDYMQVLSDRLRRVRVCCGDWSRICGPSSTFHNGLTGVFLDPPYANDLRLDGLYTEDKSLSAEVQEWCLKNQDNPLLRIALCGYDGEYDLPDWDRVDWKAQGGYSNQAKNKNDNRTKERVWFSPHCLGKIKQMDLTLI